MTPDIEIEEDTPGSTPITTKFLQDVQILKERLPSLKTFWDGKESIQEMKAANYHSGQMEWWGFYFELLCFQVLADEFVHPGDTFNHTVFDMKRSLNWDLKGKAIKSDSSTIILNACSATDASVEKHGEHGLLIALCDVEYNDVNRSFQQWHTEFNGGKSKYQVEREKRTSNSRYRKTKAQLVEILILRFTKSDLPYLGLMKQGRNSNNKPRPTPKYLLNLNKIDRYLVDRISFPAESQFPTNIRPYLETAD